MDALRFTTTNPSTTTTGAYAAANDSNRRRRVSKSLWSEDRHLPAHKRKALTASSRDAVRNFALACWMVRKHLDYTTKFTFQAKTEDEGLNSAIEAVIKRRSLRENCDAAKRHSLSRMLRIVEARRVVDGDILAVKLTDGMFRGNVQLIESELVNSDEKNTPDVASANYSWCNGVLCGETNNALAYSICKRKDDMLEFLRTVDARDSFLFAYYDGSHRVDMVRGVSPLASGLNTLRDVFEGFDFALAKVKVAQMFGLKITKEVGSDNPTGYGVQNSGDATTTDYNVDLSHGPFQLEMDPGDNAEFIESATPATETTNFLELMVQVVLRSLDLPFSFFDESSTNFFGSRAALQHYLRSCESKIEDLQELLNWLTKWWLGIAVFDGELVLPGSVEFDALKWDWVPQGVPWWDPSKEIRGALDAVGADLDNVERICRETGTDYRENVRLNAAALRYRKEIYEAEGVEPLGHVEPVAAAPVADPADDMEGDDDVA